MRVVEWLVAAWLVLGVPVAGRQRYRRLRERALQPGELARFYRLGMLRQWLLALLVLAVAVLHGNSWQRLGLRPQWHRDLAFLPRALLLVVLAGGTVWLLRVQRRRRPDTALLDKMLAPVRALLPRTPLERRLFAGVAVTAGVTEEFLYRGFLVAFVRELRPGWGLTGALVATSIAFGVAHAYQGVPGVVGTGLVGFALASIYATTGSLLMPMALHALIDLRVLLLVTVQPEVSPPTPAAGAAPP